MSEGGRKGREEKKGREEREVGSVVGREERKRGKEGRKER